MFALTGLALGLAGPAYAAPPGGDPPSDPGARTGGGQTGTSTGNTGSSFGGFSPPSGAQFDPNTTADPGLLDQAGAKAEDRTYGPTGTGDQLGYDIIDPRAYQVESGYDSEIPDYHVVQDGDTLSGICEYYYGDLYLWPKVWAFNPHITNPHWIFPGDRIRLTDPYDSGDDGPEGPGLAYAETYDPRDGGEQTFLLERYAFIDEEELAKSMKIIGGADAKVMMSTLDTAYIGYDENNPPIPGERLSIYRPKQPVYDVKIKGKKGQRQKKGKRIGWLVEVVGEAYVTSVAEKSAEANIVDSVQPVERGLRVGELKTRFTRVSSSANEVTANGVVVETIRDATITGEEQFVIINLGADDGLKRGNTLEVVEKGDAYTSDHRLIQPYEKGHPRRVLGNLVVLQVEDDSALAAVTFSLQEIVIGNHVEITEAGEEPADHERYDPAKRKDDGAEASGEVETDDGELKGEGALKMGG
ncbi:LysM peptidoglycan-binding domain-containing protein [Nannocystaceae bacterium ST9]